jgi:hypothetical protein
VCLNETVLLKSSAFWFCVTALGTGDRDVIRHKYYENIQSEIYEKKTMPLLVDWHLALSFNAFISELNHLIEGKDLTIWKKYYYK